MGPQKNKHTVVQGFPIKQRTVKLSLGRINWPTWMVFPSMYTKKLELKHGDFEKVFCSVGRKDRGKIPGILLGRLWRAPSKQATTLKP